jgi:branched-chain amino acid transport system permease protein
VTGDTHRDDPGSFRSGSESRAGSGAPRGSLTRYRPVMLEALWRGGSVNGRRTGDPVCENARDQHTRVARVTSAAYPYLVIVAFVVLWPVIVRSEELIYLGVTIMVYAALAYSLDAVYSTVGLLPMSQGMVWGVGAYLGVILALHVNLPFLLTLLLAGLAAAVVNLLVVLPALRLSGHYYLIMTFAAAEAVTASVTNISSPALGGALGLTLVQPAELFGYSFQSSTQLLYLAGGLLIVVMLVLAWLRATRLGRGMVSVRENPTLARALGVQPWKYLMAAFAISGFLAGMIGVIYAYQSLNVSAGLFDGWASVQIALVLLIGGSRTRLGPFAGALVVYMLPQILGLGPVATQIAYGISLMALILFLPSGLVGGLPAAMRSARRRYSERAKAAEV